MLRLIREYTVHYHSTPCSYLWSC